MRESKSVLRLGRRRRMVFLLFAMLPSFLAFTGMAPTPAAADHNIIYTNDIDGPDDVPAQTDVTRLGFDDTHLPDYYVAVVQFDDTAYPGGNSGDGCIFFDDDDAEGFTDFAVCGSFIQNTNTGQVELQSAALYDCKGSEPNNDEGKRCGFTGGGGDGSNGIIAQDLDGDGVFESDGNGDPLPTPYDTTCSLTTTAPDPFNGVGAHNAGGEQDPITDTALTCTIYADELVELDGDVPTGISVSNACSFTSPDPGSESKDCIVDAGSGQLTIVKNTDGADATFDFTIDGVAYASITTSGGSGSFGPQLVRLEDVNLAEVVPSGWELDSAVCSDGQSPSSLTIEGGADVTCTFTNSQSVGSLTLIKNVDNLGESGDGYLEAGDFPLTVDGSPVVSGASNDYDAGSVTIAETPQDGYTVGTWSCTDGTSGVAGDPAFTVDVPAGGSVTCEITNTLVANTDLGITKTIIAVDSAGDGILNTVGDIIDYQIVATNNGNVALNNVTVSDPLLGTLVCTPTQPATLAAGASITCTDTYAITQADLDSNGTVEPDDLLAGQLDNTATASSDETGPVTASAAEPLDQNASLGVTKTATKIDEAGDGSLNAVGDIIEYEIVATNNGTVTLTNVQVSDPLLGTLTCDPALGSSLAPGVSITCTGTYAITQADFDTNGGNDDGDIDNTATADSDETDPVDASEEVPLAPAAALGIDKTIESVDAAGDGILNAVGEIIDYQIVATNTGNVTLTNVTVSDPLLGTLDCTPTQPTSLAPGASITCTGSYAITQTDLDTNGGGNGAIDNTATADSNETDPVQDSESEPLAPAAAMTILKEVTSIDNSDDTDGGSSVDEAGDVINYRITVTNEGNVTLTNVVVSDPLIGTLDCDPTQPASLAPNVSMTCTGSYTVTQDDIDDNGGGDGDIDNVATADSDQTGEEQDEQEVPLVQAAALDITKEATGVDTAGDDLLNKAGDVIDYTITVTNEGNQTLTNVQVSDPLLTNLVCTPALGSSLPVDGTMTCTGSYTLTQTDIDSNATAEVNNVAAGFLDNTATADSDETDPKTASEQVPLDQNPALTIAKTATSITNPDDTDGGGSVDEVGDRINYEVVVANTGNQTLTNVIVSDDLLGGTLSCPSNTLAPGADMTCTGAYTVTQDDIDAGGDIDLDGDGDNDAIHNEACVNTDPTDGLDCDTEDVTVDEEPALQIVKSVSSITSTDGVADTETVDAAGDVINYSMVVTNTGNQTLTNVQVSDPLVGDLVCDPGLGSSLAPGATMTCTGSYTVTQGDIDTNGGGDGIIENVATADSDESDPDDDDANVAIDQEPSVAIDKVASAVDPDGDGAINAAGDRIDYTITVTNSGNQVLTGVVVTDPLLGGVLTGPDSGDSDGDNELDVGEVWVYEASYTVSQADIDAGGNIDLNDPADGDNDAIHNDACVDTAETDEVCDGEDVPVLEDPELTILKEFVSITNPDTTDGGDTVDQADDVINYRITVTNTGNQTLTNVTVVDPLVGDLTCDPADNPLTLAIDAEVVCTGSYTVTQADIDGNGGGDGDIDNTATGDSDQTDPKDSSVEVPVDQAPAASVVKSTSVGSYSAVGDVIDYTVELSNDGNVSLSAADIAASLSDTLNGVDVTGELAGPFTDAAGASPVADGDTLAPGGSWFYTYSYTIVEADLDAQDSVTNVVCVNVDGGDPECSEVETPSAGLSIVKTVLSIDGDENGAADSTGDLIEYRVAVTNTGAIDLSPTVSDVLTQSGLAEPQAIGSPIESHGPDGVLEPTETWTYTFSYELSQADIDDGGDLVNEACASSDDPAVAEVCDDVTTPVVQDPELTILKEFVSITNPNGSDGGDTADQAGDVINYKITVTNTGNQTLNNVTVVDELVGDLTCTPDQPSVLAPTASMECTGSYTVTQDDIDSDGGGDGDIDNLATGDSDETDPMDDTEEVLVDRNPAMSFTKLFSKINSTDGEQFTTEVDAAGDVVVYEFIVANTGNTTLTGITVTDPLLDAEVNCPLDTLAVNQSMSCFGEYTATQDDIDTRGGGDDDIDNTATADSVETDPIEDSQDVPVVYDPQTTIMKSVTSVENADGSDSNGVVDYAGDVVNYSIVVTNTGNVTLTDVQVSDPLLGNTLECDPALGSSLAPGDAMTCTGSYAATQDDLDDNGGGDGDIDNTATATSNEAADVEDDADAPVVQLPAHTLAKTFLEDEVAVGDESSFTLVYTNTGNVTLSDIEITDTVKPLLQVQSVSTTAGNCDNVDGDGNDQTVYCEVAELAPNGSVTVTVDFKALPLVDDLVPDTGQTSGANYVFYFENGYVLYGSTEDGIAKLIAPDGTVTDANVEGRNQDIYFNAPFGGDGFQLHLSCSEVFVDGWGDLGPLESEDPEWRIVAYEVDRFNVNGNFKDCGQTFVPFEVDNTASAEATPAGGTLTPNPVTATDTVDIINLAPIEVTRDRVRRGAVEIQYFNTSQEAIEIDIIKVEWTDGDTLLSASYRDGVDLGLSGSSPTSASIDTIMPARSKDWLKLNFNSRKAPEGLTVTIVTDNGSTFEYVYS